MTVAVLAAPADPSHTVRVLTDRGAARLVDAIERDKRERATAGDAAEDNRLSLARAGRRLADVVERAVEERAPSRSRSWR
jgi:hypothetical protein